MTPVAVRQPGHAHLAWLCICALILVPLWDWPALARPWLLAVGWLASLASIAWAVRSATCGAPATRLLVAFAWAYWAVAFPVALNPYDDNTAYLVFARDFVFDFERTAQPLSERRLFSVGGVYALQGPVLQWLGSRLLGIVEPALGLALIALQVLSRPALVAGRSAAVLLGLLAMVPFAAGAVLANTASTFVLAAFTLALLELARSIFERPGLAWPGLLLLPLLPLVAATLRPTTAPFNLFVAAALCLYVALALRRAWSVAAATALAVFAFTLALVPYHRFSGSWLYPLLGRGHHITTEGHSIAASVGVGEHLQHLARAAATDPMLWLNALLFALVFGGVASRRARWVWGALLLVYLGFAAMMVVATGGLAASRYTFPVSLAVAVSLLITVAERVEARFPPSSAKACRRFVAAWATAVAAALAMAYAMAGASVAAKRLRFHEPDAATRAEVAAVQQWVRRASNTDGATLFVNTGHERYLVDGLQGRYFIMDQPGMLSPWSSEEVNYTRGLRRFLDTRRVTTVVLNGLDCEVAEAGPARELSQPPSGWQGLMASGEARNRAAVCALLGDFVVTRIGRLTVLTRR